MKPAATEDHNQDFICFNTDRYETRETSIHLKCKTKWQNFKDSESSYKFYLGLLQPHEKSDQPAQAELVQQAS